MNEVVTRDGYLGYGGLADENMEIGESGADDDDIPDEETLYLVAARDWVERNTSYCFGEGEDPAGVTLFLRRYAEMLAGGCASGVRSESIGGMSQSFETGRRLDEVVHALAAQLLGAWYRPVRLMTAVERWG